MQVNKIDEKSIRASPSSTLSDQDLVSLNIVHNVSVDTDFMKGAQPVVVFMNKGKPIASFKSKSELKSYYKAWLGVVKLNSMKHRSSSIKFFAVKKVIQRDLKRWIGSIILRRNTDPTDPNGFSLTFTFKHSTYKIIIKSMDALIQYVKLLEKAVNTYEKTGTL